MIRIIISILTVLFGQYGTVTGQTYEGWSEENDRYIITLESGEVYELEADDLNDGDRVTVYFLFGEPVRVLYEWR